MRPIDADELLSKFEIHGEELQPMISMSSVELAPTIEMRGYVTLIPGTDIYLDENGLLFTKARLNADQIKMMRDRLCVE